MRIELTNPIQIIDPPVAFAFSAIPSLAWLLKEFSEHPHNFLMTMCNVRSVLNRKIKELPGQARGEIVCDATTNPPEWVNEQKIGFKVFIKQALVLEFHGALFVARWLGKDTVELEVRPC